ncbi:MFS transporter [Paraburkholderia sediminicola]|uniref:MFS transporter n=1 Tax=Paraburkholderia sediminicola TaxID=458836 RepID=UPI0038BCBF21
METRNNEMNSTAIARDATEERHASRWVVLGASLGTAFEWYDFFLYGSLATYFGIWFFPPDNQTAGLLASLARFGAGFAVRPLGSLAFGRLGDMAGRKNTFLLTIILMGLSTAAVGVLPTFAHIGWAAPVLLVTLRLVQGLAVGGEFGGATVYIAEHCAQGVRGYKTSWIQITGSAGFLLATLVIFAARALIGPKAFAQWGWRLPFEFSLVLLALSIWIRSKLDESPVYLKMKAAGQVSKAPLTEAFAESRHLKAMLIALLSGAMPLGVTSIAASVAPLILLSGPLHVDALQVYGMMAVALVLTLPLYVVFGSLSDRIGRRRVMPSGCFLALVTCYPVFSSLGRYANPALMEFQQRVPVTVAAPDCHMRLIITPNTRLSTCDKVRQFLSRAGVNYTSMPAGGSDDVVTRIGTTTLKGFDEARYQATLVAAGWPSSENPAGIDHVAVILLLMVLLSCTAMISGPMAAYLSELFPARIRYTAVSFPFHIGNGWFGGFLPLMMSALAAGTGNMIAGVAYPIVTLAVAFLVGLRYMHDAPA